MYGYKDVFINDKRQSKKLDFKTNLKIETCEIMKEGSSEKIKLRKASSN